MAAIDPVLAPLLDRRRVRKKGEANKMARKEAHRVNAGARGEDQGNHQARNMSEIRVSWQAKRRVSPGNEHRRSPELDTSAQGLDTSAQGLDTSAQGLDTSAQGRLQHTRARHGRARVSADAQGARHDAQGL